MEENNGGGKEEGNKLIRVKKSKVRYQESPIIGLDTELQLPRGGGDTGNERLIKGQFCWNKGPGEKGNSRRSGKTKSWSGVRESRHVDRTP